MAYWFAPALVALRNDEPFAAMKTSFSAFLANMIPFLVYGSWESCSRSLRRFRLIGLARAGARDGGQSLHELQGHFRRLMLATRAACDVPRDPGSSHAVCAAPGRRDRSP
jgi:hypothetical protein